MYCGKCGSEIDKKIGLCPNCDAAALEKVTEANTKKSLKKAKRRGFSAIIALILVIAIVVSSVIFAISKGWIGNNSEEEKKKVQTTYITYLNKTIIPDVGEYDSDHPESSNEGVHSALFCDLNNDDNDEFVVAYSKKNGGNIDFNISCYEYDEETKDPVKAEENVELIGTVTPSTEPDYTENKDDVFHFPNETIVYSITYENETYIVCEHMSWMDMWSYECHIYKIEKGTFIEVSNIFVPNIGTDGTRIVYSNKLPEKLDIDNSDFDYSITKYVSNSVYAESFKNTESILFYKEGGGSTYIYDKYYNSEESAVADFFKCYGIVNKQYYTEQNDHIAINHPDKTDLIYSYCYYWEYDEDGNTIEKYEINDYTDWKSLIENTDKSNVELNNNLPTEDEQKLFEKMLNDSAFVWYYGSLNENTEYEQLMDFIINESVPSGLYTAFYGELPDGYYEHKDPKGKFDGGFSYELNADKVDWILQNVLNTKPNRQKEAYNCYYSGDKFYKRVDLGGGLDPIYKINRCMSIDANKVGFEIYCSYDQNDDYYYLYFITELKEDDSIGKYWSIYEFSSNSLLFANIQENNDDSIDITENDLKIRYRNALDLYSYYFYGYGDYQDFNDTINKGEYELAATSYGEIDTYEELLNKTKKYFTEDAAVKLLKSIEAQDCNGKLYARANGGVGSAECKETISFQKVDNHTFKMESKYHWDYWNEESTDIDIYTRNFVYQNNRWVLDDANLICGFLDCTIN